MSVTRAVCNLEELMDSRFVQNHSILKKTLVV
jgi:hypothetical protein